MPDASRDHTQGERGHAGASGTSAGASGAWKSDLALILIVFFSLRLMMMWWFMPRYTEAGGFFYPITSLTSLGRWPFLDFWVEYPPVLTWLMVGLRQMTTAMCGSDMVAMDRMWFVRATQIHSVVWEGTVLALVYGLTRFAHDTKAAVKACWVYIALFPTAFVALSYLDTMPVALMLGGLALAVYRRPAASGFALGLGFMTKILPGALLPVVWKSEVGWRRRLICLAAFAAVSIACIAPFAVKTTDWVRCSFESSMRRPAWQTVWALLDGRYGFGYVGPPPSLQTNDFYDPERFGVAPGTRQLIDSLAPEVFGNPAQQRTNKFRVASRFAKDLSFIDADREGPRGMSWSYTLGLCFLGLVYVLTMWRLPASLSPMRRLWFGAFTLCVFFLASKGWSPQFVGYVIPVFLIVFGPFEGAAWALALGLTAFAETPVWSHHFFGRPDSTETAKLILRCAVSARTALLGAAAIRIYPRLFRG